MDLFSLVSPLIGLATNYFKRSTIEKRKEYTARLAELEIAFGKEKLKPLEHQDDGKIEELLLEITAIAKVAEHEARLANND